MPERFRALARRFPTTTRVVWALAVAVAVADVVLLARRAAFASETTRLRAAMTASERDRVDAALVADSNRLAVIVELARRDARGDERLHLAVALDSGRMHLEQQGAVLRTMPVDVGPDLWVHHTASDSVLLTAPRGARTIERILGDSALALSGGAMLYARAAGDSARAMPGSVRVAANELRVLLPSLQVGQRVYFY
ncbi:MAG: hypothetical protein HYR75_04710 [Gemmatimonadetes bacterium]|nr:hypothetical protein [Gemmatimonadota bacterium]MBI3566657.1 hypothetical protein [Gemmatimonadota bacterium]